ncbi:hypothetical protein PsYK624_103910 [Phanerochaete sordida]|uniref:Uncharacterized protein n=1 Tax=Phanerochaete sordida TaxID=48140 RepID=A0A9P3GFZ6_9APHY|nr:hypothetical protein PsYK624_103910 [Phanerochaete sordida]
MPFSNAVRIPPNTSINVYGIATGGMTSLTITTDTRGFAVLRGRGDGVWMRESSTQREVYTFPHSPYGSTATIQMVVDNVPYNLNITYSTGDSVKLSDNGGVDRCVLSWR